MIRCLGKLSVLLVLASFGFFGTLFWLRPAYGIREYLIEWPSVLIPQWAILFPLMFLNPITNALGWLLAGLASMIGGSLLHHHVPRISRGIASLLVGVLAVSCAVASAQAIGAGTPSDETMLNIFQEHQTAFRTLIDMLSQDQGLKVVARDRTDPKDPSTIGVSKERIRQYRHLCWVIRVKGIYVYKHDDLDGGIDFTVTSSPYFDASSKGYQYGNPSRTDIVPNLDKYVAEKKRLDAREHYGAYRNINEQWQLYYIH